MSKKILASVGIVLVFLLAATLARSTADKTDKADTENVGNTDKKKYDDLYAQVELFSYALTTVQSEYVEEKKPA